MMQKNESSNKRKINEIIGPTMPPSLHATEWGDECLIGPVLPTDLSDEVIDDELDDNSRVGNVIGPTMPSAEELAQALENYQGTIIEEEQEDDDDDDVIGPALPKAKRITNTHQTLRHQTPLGGQVVIPLAVIRSEKVQKTSVSNSGGREEWMLTPGESKASQSLSDTFGVSRGFQSGKVAKQKAKELEAMRSEQPRDAAEDARTQAILEEYREKRGPSLMDQHLQKKKDGGSGSQKDSRRPFDRERDVLQRKPMDAAAARELVQQAKNLDTRFSSGNIQRNFL